MNRNRGAGIIDEHLLAGAVLLSQHHILSLQPTAVQLAEATVVISIRVLVAILLPEQLQGDVLIGLQLVSEAGVVRFRQLFPGRRCFPGRGDRLAQAVVVPVGDIGPL